MSSRCATMPTTTPASLRPGCTGSAEGEASAAVTASGFPGFGGVDLGFARTALPAALTVFAIATPFDFRARNETFPPWAVNRGNSDERQVGYEGLSKVRTWRAP